MSGASITVKSARGSQHRIPIPDDGEVHSYSDDHYNSRGPSTSEESFSSGSWEEVDYRDNIAPSDSASRSRDHHSRSTRRPQYPAHSSRSSSHRTGSSSYREREERSSRRRHRHDPLPEAPPPHPQHSPYGPPREPHRRAPSVISSSLDYPPYSGYVPHEEYPYDHQDPQWPASSRYPTGPPTMMSAATSASHYPMGALTPYEYFGHGAAYPGSSSSNPFTPSQSSANPFVPPPAAPSPASAYYPDQHYPHHAAQRPGAMTRRSYIDPHGMPPYPHQPYPMIPYGFYPTHQSPPPQHDRSSPASEKSKKEKEPAPAAAAPPPPPPKSEEEIKKEKEAEEAAHTTRVLEALRLYNEEERAKATAAETVKQAEKKESDRIAAIFEKYEKARVAREEAALKKAEQEKAAALAQAARDKELADASAAAREKAEKEAAEREKAAADEATKKLAEAKKAAEEAEAAKKAVEAELAKHAPEPDAGKPPLKFHDCVDRHFTLPWHLAKTWKGMEALIKQAFVHIERIGPHIANGNYSLLGPNDEIILPQVWEIVVQPGWEIKMDMWPLPDPIEEMVAFGPGGFGPLDHLPPIKGKGKSPKGEAKAPARKTSKRVPIPGPPPPPMHHPPAGPIGHPDDILYVEEPPRPNKPNTKKPRKQVPAFTRWMLGTKPPKGHEKQASSKVVRV